ncbi:MAG: hypothetical protein K9M03_00935 [Kiritimatiellales bacterium]|nr:hypothetical protein [Kiritimatiellales bacterium]
MDESPRCELGKLEPLDRSLIGNGFYTLGIDPELYNQLGITPDRIFKVQTAPAARILEEVRANLHVVIVVDLEPQEISLAEWPLLPGDRVKLRPRD